MNITPPQPRSRREFLGQSSLLVGAALAAPTILPSRTFAQPNSDTLRIGLIGCGGRGGGAADDALTADPHVILTAMGDLFEDRLQGTLLSLKKAHGERVRVTPASSFAGLEAYLKVIQSDVDVVILATPPGFRPAQIKAAIEAGKHVFAEKPLATDAAGVRSVLASAATAKQKRLSLLSGFCYRHHPGVRALMERLHQGEIGELRALHNSYNAGGVWNPFPRQPAWTDLQYQIKNWYYYTWLSGDHIVEQAVHNIDKMNWAMKDEVPVKCVALGGRQTRVAPEFGHIFDHFAVVYEYATGAKGFHYCRQQNGAASDVSDHFLGTEGGADIVRAFNGPFVVRGKSTWRFREDKPSNMYRNEHVALFAGIRAGQPLNEGVSAAHSTLTAIMGRMAAYTGQEVTWEQALNSAETLVPASLDLNTSVPVPPVALPGITKLI
jgi:myo-inositol 2-dehydrogenase/D-chiro-inositol 1-dehydrogenase